jgi:hypothetical protein
MSSGVTQANMSCLPTSAGFVHAYSLFVAGWRYVVRTCTRVITPRFMTIRSQDASGDTALKTSYPLISRSAHTRNSLMAPVVDGARYSGFWFRRSDIIKCRTPVQPSQEMDTP